MVSIADTIRAHLEGTVKTNCLAYHGVMMSKDPLQCSPEQERKQKYGLTRHRLLRILAIVIKLCDKLVYCMIQLDIMDSPVIARD